MSIVKEGLWWITDGGCSLIYYISECFLYVKTESVCLHESCGCVGSERLLVLQFMGGMILNSEGMWLLSLLRHYQLLTHGVSVSSETLNVLA